MIGNGEHIFSCTVHASRFLAIGKPGVIRQLEDEHFIAFQAKPILCRQAKPQPIVNMRLGPAGRVRQEHCIVGSLPL